MVRQNRPSLSVENMFCFALLHTYIGRVRSRETKRNGPQQETQKFNLAWDRTPHFLSLAACYTTQPFCWPMKVIFGFNLYTKLIQDLEKFGEYAILLVIWLNKRFDISASGMAQRQRTGSVCKGAEVRFQVKSNSFLTQLCSGAGALVL